MEHIKTISKNINFKLTNKDKESSSYEELHTEIGYLIFKTKGGFIKFLNYNFDDKIMPDNFSIYLEYKNGETVCICECEEIPKLRIKGLLRGIFNT